jgi:hypothetical protein
MRQILPSYTPTPAQRGAQASDFTDTSPRRIGDLITM